MHSASRFASPALKAVYHLSDPREVLAAAEALTWPSPGDIMPSGSKETPHWLLLALEVGDTTLTDVIETVNYSGPNELIRQFSTDLSNWLIGIVLKGSRGAQKTWHFRSEEGKSPCRRY